MLKLVITREVHNLIRNHAINEFRDTSKQVGPDLFEISVDEQVMARIKAAQMKGESDSDTLLRLFHFWDGRKRN